MAGGGSSGGQSQTVTQTQQIPAFEQQFAQSNQNLAASLGSQPYPMYQGGLVQPMNDSQQQGEQLANTASGAYQPYLNAATQSTLGASNGINTLQNAMSYGAPQVQEGQNYLGTAQAFGLPQVQQGEGMVGNSAYANPLVGQGAGVIGHALAQNPANAQTMQSYMSPYVQQALAPQIQALQTQLGQQQNQIAAQATGANAFGDARQGVEQANQNFLGNQALSGLVANGYNTAFTNALNTATQEQGLGLNAGSALMGAGAQQQQIGQQAGQDLANIGSNQQNFQANIGQSLAGIGENQQAMMANVGQQLGSLGLQQGQQLGNLGNMAQQLGLTGANAVYNVGQQQQQQGQQELNTAYQQFMNQAQWPYQGLNIRESALSNSPYNITNQTTLPNANQTAQNLGMFASLAGLAGGGGSSLAPFGGQPYNAGQAQA